MSWAQSHAMASGTLLAQLSYDSAVRALDLQERALEQLRARTSTLLAASSVTASFLGLQATQHATSGTLGAFALVSLAGSVGLCAYVLLPKSDLVFSLSAPTMYEELIEFDDDNELRKRLIYWLEVYWLRNQRHIDTLDRCYFCATMSLLLQLVFWSWILLDHLVR
jgi:hypothetical protein